MTRGQILRRFLASYLSVNGRPLPTFLIIGAQKAGTSSLFEYLAEHPDVTGSWIKEVHFFSRRYALGLRAYRSLFPKADLGRPRPVQVGEASPVYLFDPEVPARVWATLPRVKLIAMLREPAERAYSHYSHNVRRGHERRTFEEAVAADLRKMEEAGGIGRAPGESYAEFRHFSYIRRGFYLQQLERWFGLFDREDILLMRAEYFFADPSRLTREALEFLGLPACPLSTDKAHNQFAYQRKTREELGPVRARFAEANERLREATGISW